MNRVEYLNNRLETKHFIESDYTIISSLIHALPFQEACSFLDLTFNQDYRIRRYVFKKISNDISRSYRPEHKKLVSTLIKKLDEKGFIKKESCSYGIDLLFESLPTREKNQILKVFLNSKSSRNRDRAFKRINSNWNKKYQIIIEQTWYNHRDPFCLQIILNHFSSEFLLENYKNILIHTKPHQTSKLFLRLGAINLDLVNELKNIDQISYSYVLTKFNKKLSDSEAKEFLRNNFMDDRIGLLLWCYGQMGLWDSIVEYDNKYKGKHNLAKFEKYVHT
jgi:hypothetical protein